MNYLKAMLLPVFVAILLTTATSMLEALAVQQYFSGGPGQALGELVWTTRIPVYTLWLELIVVSMWAGYRTANAGGVWVAAISSGALVYASFVLFWALGGFLSRGAAEAGEFLDGPYAGQAKLLLLTIAGGAVGTWLRARPEHVT